MIAILVLTIEWVWDGRCGRTLYKGLVTLVKFMAHIYIYKAVIAGTSKNVCPSKFYGGVLISCHIVITQNKNSKNNNHSDNNTPLIRGRKDEHDKVQ